MPKDLKDFPRPPNDNGRGLHGSALAGWSVGDEGYAFWVNELVEMGIKWFKVLDDAGNSLPLCEHLLAAGIFPIVRIIRRDPPPNDTPEPNPGHLAAPEEETLRRLIAAGVRYFETNNEPDLAAAWKHRAMPGDALEAAKLVALNWLFDARLILSLGGLPGLPAISSGGTLDLMGALVALGRHDILLEGCWIAVHNYCGNRPLNYPDDPVNRAGHALTAEEHNLDMFTEWAWWNLARERADTLDEINTLRARGANPATTIQHDHACFREFEYYNALALKYLGRSIPIIGTEGGYRIGRRDDLRYPRVTPLAQRDQTVALFDWMQRQAPDYFFAAAPSLLVASPGWEPDAWLSSFWRDTFASATPEYVYLPPIPVRGHGLGDRLPVINAVKEMQTLARRLPGAQPAPPSVVTLPQREAAPAVEPPTEKPVVAPAYPSWLRDVPLPPAPTPSPAPPPTITEPAPAPVAAPMPPPPPPEIFPTEIEFEWDWRLDALGVTLDPARVLPGRDYWKLVRAIYQAPDESGGTHHIRYSVLDENAKPVANQTVWQGWAEDKTSATTDAEGETEIPLWTSFAPEEGESGAYAAWVDGLPSDRVQGLGLPHSHHVNFVLTWQRATR